MFFLLPDMKIQVFPDLSPEWGGKNDFSDGTSLRLSFPPYPKNEVVTVKAGRAGKSQPH